MFVTLTWQKPRFAGHHRDRADPLPHHRAATSSADVPLVSAILSGASPVCDSRGEHWTRTEAPLSARATVPPRRGHAPSSPPPGRPPRDPGRSVTPRHPSRLPTAAAATSHLGSHGSAAVTRALRRDGEKRRRGRVISEWSPRSTARPKPSETPGWPPGGPTGDRPGDG